MAAKSQISPETSSFKFAVLLAAYNGKHWLEDQITSILNQRNVAVDLFISVDPSVDETQRWCEELARQDSRVNLLPDVGVFGGAAKNFFRLLRDVDIFDYDYVSFSDQDDVWFENKLWTAHEAICTRNVQAYSANVIAVWPNGREILLPKAQPQKKWDFLFEAAGPGCTYVFDNTLACAIKRTVITQWDLVQNVYLHDWFFYAFARSNGYKWYIDPTPSMRYRQHETNQVGINSGLCALFKRWSKVARGYGLEQSRLIGSIVGLYDNPFYQSWSKLDFWGIFRLAFRAYECRRRRRDQVYFFFTCLILSIKFGLSSSKQSS